MSDVPDGLRERIESDPFCEAVGVDLVSLAPGRATTRLAVTDDHLNFHGTLHGAACYALADAAFAAASNSHGDAAVALETNVSYLDAANAGETLEATARETHRSERTAEYEVTVERVPGSEPADGSQQSDDCERVASFRGRVYLPD